MNNPHRGYSASKKYFCFIICRSARFFGTSWVKRVHESMECKNCGQKAIKRGKTKSGRQRFSCRACGCCFEDGYVYMAYHPDINSRIVAYLKEGVGIRGTARLLKISKTTVLRRILEIAANVPRPKLSESHQSYEMDELRTYIRSKQNEVWICYAINRKTREVVDFVVGRRTKKNLSQVTEILLLLHPRYIFTDGLNTYRSLIPKNVHRVGKWGTLRIERMNLTLRTHVRRLFRRTIGFSFSLGALQACLKIYFWGIREAIQLFK